MKKVLLAAAAVLAGSIQAPASSLIFQSIYHYVYTPLPVPSNNPNYLDLEPMGINNNNQVVGTAYIPGYGGPEAFLTTSNKTQIYLFPSAYLDCVGFGINDAGTIVGEGTLANADHAFYADAGQAVVDLDSNPQHNSSARAVANNGYFVGTTNFQPALGNIPGHWIISLGQTLGNDFFIAGMNDNLMLVGSGQNGGAIYDVGTGTVTQLSTVLGTINNKATAINQAGVAAGTVGHRGFIYSNGSVTYFGNNIQAVNSINSSNNVVGSLTNGHGFVYTASTQTITDLNTLLPSSMTSAWTVTQGIGINDKNSICGMATRPAKAADESKGWYTTVYQGFTLIIESIYTVGPVTTKIP